MNKAHPELGKPELLALFREYDSGKLTQAQFAESKGININTIHKAFAKIAKEEEEHCIARAKRLLAKTAPNAVEQLKTALDSGDGKLAVDAAKAILDRTGLSPQAATINIQNVQAGQAVIVPLLAESDAALLQKLAGG